VQVSEMGNPGNMIPLKWLCGGNMVYKKYKNIDIQFVFKKHIILRENKNDIHK
jgi:hypothetical protein